MNKHGTSGIITAAMLVAGMRLWMQIRGKTKTPFSEWVVGWGATFFVLSLISDVAPGGAAMLAWVIVIADFMKNGVSLTTDISSVVTGTETGGTILTPTPFAATPAPVSGKVG